MKMRGLAIGCGAVKVVGGERQELSASLVSSWGWVWTPPISVWRV